MQTALVIAIVAVAAIYVLRRLLSRPSGSCGCGCSGCPSGSDCGSGGIADLRSPDSPADRKNG